MEEIAVLVFGMGHPGWFNETPATVDFMSLLPPKVKGLVDIWDW